jgi:hypothetical protein
MAVADDCVPQLGVCATRVASLDTSGKVAGGTTMYVSDALQKLTIKPNFEAGDEIKEKNGCGDVYVDFKGADSLLWYDVEFEFLTPDPYLLSLIVPLSTLISASGGRVGWASPAIGSQTSNKVSIEFWTKRVSSGALSSSFPYAHHALPGVQNMRLGDRTIDVNAQHAVVDGQAVNNSGWFDGPANDWPTDDGGGGYLDRPWKWVPSTTKPTAQCGPIADVAS